jgi:hypothetical protein
MQATLEETTIALEMARNMVDELKSKVSLQNSMLSVSNENFKAALKMSEDLRVKLGIKEERTHTSLKKTSSQKLAAGEVVNNIRRRLSKLKIGIDDDDTSNLHSNLFTVHFPTQNLDDLVYSDETRDLVTTNEVVDTYCLENIAGEIETMKKQTFLDKHQNYVDTENLDNNKVSIKNLLSKKKKIPLFQINP